MTSATTVKKQRSDRGRMFSEIWRRFKKNKQAMVGLVILVVFILIALFADAVTPYGYDDQDASRAMLFPSLEYPFGTDNLGRDVLSRLIYGSRYSLMIGFFAVGISVVLGGLLGVLAAYYPKLDNGIMRTMDLFMAIPQMLLAICIVSALGSGLFNLMLAVGLSSTPQFARVVRASVLTTREQEFVEAARAIGAGNGRIILQHILPNSISPLIVQATLSMARAIISASALSFLGFGIQPPEPEWGAMLSAGRMYIRTQWYLTVIPGLAIMAVVYALNVVGDGLRDCLDPRLKK
ncbi:MAG TPA: ABC transporter permease [Clostridia bacterium]|nr:ABC transporter permease [Clostridia bacterium]